MSLKRRLIQQSHALRPAVRRLELCFAPRHVVTALWKSSSHGLASVGAAVMDRGREVATSAQ